MKKLQIIISAALLSLLTILAAPAVHAQILVDDDNVQCPTATFSNIQAAIDAASPGETIRVCAGTYHEQLKIDKAITLAADNGVVLSPMGMTANATGSTQSDLLAAAIVVKNTTGVLFSGFIIDGSGNGITECSPRLIGVLFQDASGQAKHNAVRHFRLNPSPNGCQSGNAIEVQTRAGSESVVTILENSVDDYQKNGITANETGSTVTIQHNVVVGLGPTSGAAQNGIQIGFGASGVIVNNDISDNVWSPCVSLAQCDTDATGVLIFQSNNVQVTANTIGTDQIGIFTNGTGTQITSNRVGNSLVLDGVALVSDNNNVARNEITQSGRASVLVQGKNNIIFLNVFLAADFGILFEPGSSGTNHRGNEYAAILTPVGTDATPDAAAKQGLVTSNAAKLTSGSGSAAAGAQVRVSPSR
jgi:nitrous oxidase accessory protein NosD